MADIELRGLTKDFPGGVRAIDDLDLTIADGEFFALLGPSGCGKTTLLRTIAGLEEASAGRLLVGGDDVTRTPPGGRDVAMVFQDYALFPHMTVAQNIAYPLRIKKVDAATRRAKAEETGAALELGHLMERRPAQLSGGQQQRVALARAIACRPRVFLFDEPLSNLDARLRLEARTHLKKLQRELGVTTVFVTHDQAEALALADRMAVMESGRVRQLGTPTEVFQRPANTFVADFIGSTPMNLLTGVVADGGVRVAGSVLPTPRAVGGSLSDGDEVTYGIRPEYLELSTERVAGAAEGTVGIVASLGAASLVSVDVDGTSWSAVVTEGAEPSVGARVWLRPQPDRVLIYRTGDGELVDATRTAGAPA